MLFVSIFKVITTNPGNIPSEKEWDIQTSDSAYEQASNESSN